MNTTHQQYPNRVILNTVNEHVSAQIITMDYTELDTSKWESTTVWFRNDAHTQEWFNSNVCVAGLAEHIRQRSEDNLSTSI